MTAAHGRAHLAQALIQRNANSPREVARLARGQERTLRTLLYGARAASGGGRVGNRGYFVEPTVLTDTTPDIGTAPGSAPRPTATPLPVPTEREKTQWYFQRYVAHLPAFGEIVLFDRSWYNRLGVEYVMGFCSKEQHAHFLELCPEIEKYIVDGGIRLIKIWLEVGMEEQERRFAARVDDPLRQWKLSPMDIESYTRWYDYSRARDMMLKATDTKYAPWFIVRSDDKRRGRLNCIAHILQSIPYKKIRRTKVKLPKRSLKGKYDDQSVLKGRRFVAEVY